MCRLTLFKKASLSGESVSELVKDYNGLEVQSKEVDTAYSLGNGDKKLSVYTFTDARGNTVEINDANAKEFIKQEEVAFDGILQGVLDEILSGKISLPEDDSGASGYDEGVAA